MQQWQFKIQFTYDGLAIAAYQAHDGVWRPGVRCPQVVLSALESGWPHCDNLSIYRLEPGLLRLQGAQVTIGKVVCEVMEVREDSCILRALSGPEPDGSPWPSDTPVEGDPITEIGTDLKWAAWSASPGYWVEMGYGFVLEALETLRIGESLTINSSAWKEIRYVSVDITRAEHGYLASGVAYAPWDEVEEIADTFGLLDESGRWRNGSKAAFQASLPWTHSYGSPGVELDFTVEASTLEGLLEQIDREEERLISESERQFEELELMYRDAQDQADEASDD